MCQKGSCRIYTIAMTPKEPWYPFQIDKFNEIMLSIDEKMCFFLSALRFSNKSNTINMRKVRPTACLIFKKLITIE